MKHGRSSDAEVLKDNFVPEEWNLTPSRVFQTTHFIADIHARLTKNRNCFRYVPRLKGKRILMNWTANRGGDSSWGFVYLWRSLCGKRPKYPTFSGGKERDLVPCWIGETQCPQCFSEHAMLLLPERPRRDGLDCIHVLVRWYNPSSLLLIKESCSHFWKRDLRLKIQWSR